MTHDKTISELTAAALAGTSGETRCGFVALIGAPNAGKSTLTNRLVGSKVAIVSHKVQTTRSRVMGLAIEGNCQLVLIDTPGIFTPKRRLDRAMVDAAWRGSDEAENTVLVLDARKGVNEEIELILKGLENAGRKVILALNKIDEMRRDKLLQLSDRLYKTGLFSEIFMISALTGDGTQDLKAHLAAKAPVSPWHYPEDQISDMTLRLMAAEITREKIYERLHDELPYATMVETEAFEERKDGSFKIEQVIHVERDSQKGIVIGKGGQMLKTLGQLARKDMEVSFDCVVHLFLHVRVSAAWGDDRDLYESMGLEFPKGN